MKIKSVVIILVLPLLFTGCFVMGKNKEFHPFDTQYLSEVAAGSTTAQEICDMFGAPTDVVRLVNGNAYLYRRSVAKATGLSLILISFGKYDKQYDQMVFFFDSENKLTHYAASLDADKTSYGFPF